MSITSATARVVSTAAMPAAPPVAPSAGPGAALDRLKSRLPEHARDLRINLGVIAAATALTPQQAWGTALTAALTARNAEVSAAIADAAAPYLSAEAVFAARGTASIMAMSNVYNRFIHMMGEDSDYGQMPVRLRMQLIGKPGVDPLDFELWCLAAAAITGCEHCVRSHEATVRDRNGTVEQVHEAVRIAAVVHAVALALATAPSGEAAL
jgi:alkyl hydroperoxide reductase subunit D